MRRLREFLNLGVIIGNLPNNILDGQYVDAVPVMGNFNYIVSQVNANVPPLIPGGAGNTITFVPVASVGGTPNAITLAPIPAIAGYAAGQSFRFPAVSTNTGSVTIATSGLAVRALQYANGSAITGGEIVAGGIYDICDNGTAYDLINSSQGSLAFGSWTPTISFGGASVGVAYALQVGSWYKINNMVLFSFEVVLASKGASVGAMAISGLPFVVNALWLPGGQNTGSAVTAGNCITNNGWYTLLFAGGSTSVQVANSSPSAASFVILDTQVANNSGFSASGFYLS